MGSALDQPLLMQFVEHAHQRDRLDAQPGCHLRVTDPCMAGDVEHHCRLLARDRHPHLPRPTLEPPLDQPRYVMDEKAEGAADLGSASLEPAVRRLTSRHWR